MSVDSFGQVEAFFNQCKNKKAQLVVVGDWGLDRFIFGGVDRISQEAPVPILNQEKVEDRPGCAANVSLNLAEWVEELKDLKVASFGVVGEDAEAAILRALFNDKKIQVELFTDSSRPTTLKTRYLAGYHQLLRVDRETLHPVHADCLKKLGATLLQVLPQAQVLLIQDYAKGLFGEAFVQSLLSACRERGVFSIVDPNSKTPPEYYRGASLITPNVAEAEGLSGLKLHKGSDAALIEQALVKIQKNLNIGNVMITRSQHGMSLIDEKQAISHFPTFAHEVSDVTGAGDTVVAAFAMSHALGASLETSCLMANAAAGVVVSKIGTATASLKEIFLEIKSRPKN